MTASLSGAELGARLTRMRQATPLIHHITNYVAMNSAANVLLALGASPAMVHARQEAAEFASLADALSVNIGTLSPAWVEAMVEAATSARAHAKPWVLDPVAVGATTYRREVAGRLLACRPTVIRGNASEIIALHGATAGGRGVDSTAASDEALAAAVALARNANAVVAVTGEVDLVTDGQRLARVPGGHALMPRVTTLGCALSGVVAAFVASGDDAFEDCIGALACYGEAGRRAGRDAHGPGSFASAFLDELYRLDADALIGLAPLEIAHVP